MKIDAKPIPVTPEYLLNTQLDYGVLIIASIFAVMFTYFFLFKRIKTAISIYKLKKQLMANKITAREAAYSLNSVIEKTSSSTFKALMQAPLIRSLKYNRAFKIDNRELISYLRRASLISLFGKY